MNEASIVILMIIAGALAVYMTGNTNPKDLAMGLLAGVVPLAMRWANPNDHAFGSSGK